MHPRSGLEREYLCRVHGEVPDEVLEKLKAGVELEDGPARFDDIAIISRGGSHCWFRVVIREGRNREVRRLWDSQGFLVSRLKRIRYGNLELPRTLRRGGSEALGEDATRELRKIAGLGDPQPVLTLSPVLHQRRASRNVTEYRPPSQGGAMAWSGAARDEARELSAYDRIREEPTRGKQQRRPRGEVNGNVARPDKAPNAGRRKNGRRGVAPGQELPSVRTWFAGDSREGGAAAGTGTGNRRPGAGGKPAGNRFGGGAGNRNAAGGNRAGGGNARGGNAGNSRGNAGGGGNRGRSGGSGGGRPQGSSGGGNRPQGGGRGGNRHGNR
jgi:23S rRNA pseudouridine2605 synthase